MTRQHPAAEPDPTSQTGAPARTRVDVDHNRCQLFGLCQQEAPAVFDLGVDGRLRYDARPDAEHTDAVRSAARCCPMQAITAARIGR